MGYILAILVVLMPAALGNPGVPRIPSDVEVLGERVAQVLPRTSPYITMQISIALVQSCGEFNVDPELMLALIRVESFGDPLIRSKVGAVGLTQVMPETGEQIARKLGVPWTGEAMLEDVHTNVRFGTYYMRKLLDRFENDHAAIAAYNWGPNHVARRIIAGKPVPTHYTGKINRALERVRSTI